MTVTEVDGDVFTGRVLNQPAGLELVSEGSQIRFVVPDWQGYPVMVTDKYLHERGAWIIQPCEKCGLDVMFDAPSDLLKVAFPDVHPEAEREAFTTICGFCGGVQVVQHRSMGPGDESSSSG